MDDSTLGLLFEIAADPSKAIEGLSGLDSAATTSAAKIQQAMENAKIAIDQGLGEAMARTQLVSAGLNEEVAKLVVQQMQAAESAQALATSETEVAAASERASYSITNARMSMMELESMAGIRAPRAINTFISHLDNVGPALSMAFSGVAIVGIIDLIATQIPAALDKAESWLSGWGKTARNEFEKTEDALRKTVDQFAHFQGELAGARGGDSIEAQLKVQGQYADELRLKWAALNDEVQKLQHPKEGQEDMFLIPDLKKLTGEMDVITKQIHEVEKTMDELNQKQQVKGIELMQGRLDQIDKQIEEHAKKAAETAKRATEQAAKASEEAIRHEEERIRQYENEAKRINDEVERGIEKERRAEIEWADQTVEARINANKQIEKADDDRLKVFQRQTKELGKLAEADAKEVTKVQEEEYRKQDEAARRLLNHKIQMYREEERIALDVVSHLHGATKRWADAAIKMTEQIMLANLQKDLEEQKGIMVTAALKAKMQMADAIAAFASGNFWAGAEHTLAAAGFAALAAEPLVAAAVGGGGGGGGGASGGGGYGEGGHGGRSGGFSSLPMAAGAGVPGGSLHIVVVGPEEAGNWMAGVLTSNVRNNGTQLVASSSLG